MSPHAYMGTRRGPQVRALTLALALAGAVTAMTPLGAAAATPVPPVSAATPVPPVSAATTATDEAEVDLAHHGSVVYTEDGRLTMRLHTWNHGPVSLESAAVRVSFSAPVQGRAPAACRRASSSALVCETGPLRAGSTRSRTLDLGLRVAGAPAEVLAEVRTVRLGSVGIRPVSRDLNPANDSLRVLAPATGDTYYF
ncbi:hypothetical protein [Streptomyces sp. NPDC058657]|uniref:hypothetical protein n=1 Tax=unclassified Streptomyces TaxID=2593676 RepID=UPI0036666236